VEERLRQTTIENIIQRYGIFIIPGVADKSDGIETVQFVKD
jgi:hypothetical protein